MASSLLLIFLPFLFKLLNMGKTILSSQSYKNRLLAGFGPPANPCSRIPDYCQEKGYMFWNLWLVSTSSLERPGLLDHPERENQCSLKPFFSLLDVLSG